MQRLSPTKPADGVICRAPPRRDADLEGFLGANNLRVARKVWK
jgi:hypothetical protein